MRRRFFGLFLALAASVIGAVPGHSATLDGTTVSINLTAGGTDYGTQNLLVGVGADGNYFSNQFLDFNAGINGDIFTITSTDSYCGVGCVGNVVWTLTNLNFGAPLIGFTILQDIGAVTIDSLTANSVTFHYADTSIPEGTYFQAQFVTGVSAVPEPSTWAMLILGFAGVSFLAYRRRNGLNLA